MDIPRHRTRSLLSRIFFVVVLFAVIVFVASVILQFMYRAVRLDKQTMAINTERIQPHVRVIDGCQYIEAGRLGEAGYVLFHKPNCDNLAHLPHE